MNKTEFHNNAFAICFLIYHNEFVFDFTEMKSLISFAWRTALPFGADLPSCRDPAEILHFPFKAI